MRIRPLIAHDGTISSSQGGIKKAAITTIETAAIFASHADQQHHGRYYYG